MKGLSLFFLKNSIGANMKKSFRNSCNGQDSTSTLPNDETTADHTSNFTNDPPRKSVTLEEMILQLELEEELARRATLQHNHHHHDSDVIPRRMSCVNNSDILRSARNALNQYPRFSLDGKDSMYRSSFRRIDDRQENLVGAVQPPVRHRRRSNSVGGEIVVWCNPGVVGRLMGLEAMPVPVGRMRRKKGKMGCKEEGVWSRNPVRKEVVGVRRGEVCSSSSSRANGYCAVRPTHAAFL